MRTEWRAAKQKGTNAAEKIRMKTIANPVERARLYKDTTKFAQTAATGLAITTAAA